MRRARDEPPAVTDAGLNYTDVPVGAPVADSKTDCAHPLVTTVEIVEVSFEPRTTVRMDGLAEIEKSFETVPPEMATSSSRK